MDSRDWFATALPSHLADELAADLVACERAGEDVERWWWALAQRLEALEVANSTLPAPPQRQSLPPRRGSAAGGRRGR